MQKPSFFMQYLDLLWQNSADWLALCIYRRRTVEWYLAKKCIFCLPNLESYFNNSIRYWHGSGRLSLQLLGTMVIRIPKGKRIDLAQRLLHTWTDSLGTFFQTFIIMKISENDSNIICRSSKLWRMWLKNWACYTHFNFKIPKGVAHF